MIARVDAAEHRRRTPSSARCDRAEHRGATSARARPGARRASTSTRGGSTCPRHQLMAPSTRNAPPTVSPNLRSSAASRGLRPAISEDRVDERRQRGALREDDQRPEEQPGRARSAPSHHFLRTRRKAQNSPTKDRTVRDGGHGREFRGRGPAGCQAGRSCARHPAERGDHGRDHVLYTRVAWRPLDMPLEEAMRTQRAIRRLKSGSRSTTPSCCASSSWR